MRVVSDRYYPFFAFAAFAVVLICVFVPFIYGIYLSFTDFSTTLDAKWIGFANYFQIFDSSTNANLPFANLLSSSLKLSLFCAIAVNFISFAIAFFIAKKIKALSLFKLVVFLPGLLGVLCAGFIIEMFFNSLLASFGIIPEGFSYYNFAKVFLCATWQLSGFISLIYIFVFLKFRKNKNILDAAKLDGFSKFQVLTKIYIPAFIRPIIICFILTFLNVFRIIDRTIVSDIYNTFYSQTGLLGIAQAKATVFFIVGAVLIFILIRLIIKENDNLILEQK
jgi:raffinose/stachyose/melibiose transport system permease protein